MQAAVEAARAADVIDAKVTEVTSPGTPARTRPARPGRPGQRREDPQPANGSDESPEPITEPLPRLRAAPGTVSPGPGAAGGQQPAASETTVTPHHRRGAARRGAARPAGRARRAGQADRPARAGQTRGRPGRGPAETRAARRGAASTRSGQDAGRPDAADQPAALDPAIMPYRLGRRDRGALPRRDTQRGDTDPGPADPPSRSVPHRPAEPDQPAAARPSRPRAALPAPPGRTDGHRPRRPDGPSSPHETGRPLAAPGRLEKKQQAQERQPGPGPEPGSDRLASGWRVAGRDAGTRPRRGQAAAGRKARVSRPRVVGVAALAVVLVSAGTVAAVLTSSAQAPKPTANRTAGPRPRPPAGRPTWVASQVSHNAVVACDQLMCGALATAGFPGHNLQLIGPTSSYPVHSDVVVVTPMVRHQFGSSLATNWAPSSPGPVRLRHRGHQRPGCRPAGSGRVQVRAGRRPEAAAESAALPCWPATRSRPPHEPGSDLTAGRSMPG